jgi:hypothetical protein
MHTLLAGIKSLSLVRKIIPYPGHVIPHLNWQWSNVHILDKLILLNIIWTWSLLACDLAASSSVGITLGRERPLT